MVCSPRIKRLFSVIFAVTFLFASGVGDLSSAWARSHRNEQPAPLGIVGVSVHSDGSGFSLNANRPFSGAETRDFSVLKLPSPYRILLDIPNARLSGGQKVFPVSQNGIDRVELLETHSAFYSSVRVIVYVADSQALARLTPEFEGTALKLLGTTPIAMTSAEIATTNFAKTPIGKAVQPLPPVAKPATAMTVKQPPTPPLVIIKPDSAVASSVATKTVLDVPLSPGVAIVEDVYFRDNKLFIQSGPGSTLRVKNRFNLTEPNRLVLELDNAVLRSRDLLEPISTKAQDIRHIRVGQFDEKTVRIVIEGNDPEQCEAIYHGGEKNLLAIGPYSSTSITRLSANTRLGEVESIDLKREDHKTVLRLAASTPIVHRFLKKDDQLVLDLLNQAANPTNIAFDARLYPEIEKMRLEPLNAGEPNSKLAIQFSRSGTRVIPSVSDDGKVLELQISVEPAVANAAFPNIAGLGAAGKAPFPARIVVDAGHGGKDHGAMRGGANEKDLNLALAMMVRDALEAKGFKVYMTRSTDEFLPLPKITAITNQIRPDLFISIHHNASVNAAANGIETYYYTPQSVAFARKVHAREINAVGARDGGVKKAMFYVIHHTSVPAILCEVGYVSNPSELTALQGFERKSKTARAIADGVVDYLKTRVSANAK
jgi:N-acetylmuramoyl-L-alanine amidase